MLGGVVSFAHKQIGHRNRVGLLATEHQNRLNLLEAEHQNRLKEIRAARGFS